MLQDKLRQLIQQKQELNEEALLVKQRNQHDLAEIERLHEASVHSAEIGYQLTEQLKA